MSNAASARFLTGGALGFKPERKIFYSSSRNRGPNAVEELLETIASKFRLHCTSFLPFEEIFDHLRISNGPSWRYIQGDRSLLRAFIQNYDENFEFPEDNFTQVIWKPNQKLIAKNEFRQKTLQPQKRENEELMKERNEIYKRYDLVYEYDALNMIYAVFYHSDCEKLHFDFIIKALQRKFESSNDYAELVDYIGSSMKQYMINRFHLFVEQGDCFMRRSNFYVDVVYHLNEYIRDTSQSRNGKPLEALINYYLTSDVFTQKIRSEMNIHNRDNFLTFLQNNRFVFGIRLLKDFEISSNLCIPRLDWKKVGRDKSLVCDDFDEMLKQYDDECKKKNLLTTCVYDDDDEYFQSKFNPENAVYDETDSVDNVQLTQGNVATSGTTSSMIENDAQSKPVTNGEVANSSTNVSSSNTFTKNIVFDPLTIGALPTDESGDAWQMKYFYESIAQTAQRIINGPIPSTKVQLNQVRKHFLYDSVGDEYDDIVDSSSPSPMVYKTHPSLVRPKVSPQSTKPLLPSVCRGSLKMEALKPVGRAATVRQPGAPTWEEIEKELEEIYNDD